MQTKTYRASTMLVALQEIQREMGPNAIVLSMREVNNGPSWQVWNKPGVEVVATTEMPAPKQTPVEEPPRGIPEENIPGRKEIEAILAALSERRKLQAEPGLMPVDSFQSVPARGTGSRHEPVKWNPPVLENQKVAPEEARPRNPAVEVFDEVVHEILDSSHPELAVPEGMNDIPPLLKLIRHRLLRQGVDRDLVEHLVETNAKSLSPTVLYDERRLTAYMKKQMEASLRTQKNSMAVAQSRVICLVGATGSGKTSTCAKLAAYYHCTLEKDVIWICADTIRAGAISETRMYADTLEVQCSFAYTPQELGEQLGQAQQADLILIDTPGVNPLDEDNVAELGTYLSQVPAGAVYLTAPATTKSSDLAQTVSTFSLFKIKGIVATKMDETYSFGDLFNLLMTTHLPVHYFTDGPQVFGKLHQGDPAKLIDAIFGEGRS